MTEQKKSCLTCKTLEMCHIIHTTAVTKDIITKNIISSNPTSGFSEKFLDMLYKKFDWINEVMGTRCIHYKGESEVKISLQPSSD